MDLLTRPQPATASIARRLILLVLVAGVIDPRPGHDHPGLHHLEALFQAMHGNTPSCSTVTTPALTGRTNFDGRSVYPGTGRHSLLYTKLYTGPINTRALSSPCITTTSFNIPHQNTGDDEPFVTALM